MLEGIIDRIKTSLFESPQPPQPIVKEEGLDVKLSRMPVQYQEIFVQVVATPYILETIDSKTKLILHHLHSIVLDERRGHSFNPKPTVVSHLVDYGLAELRDYDEESEYRHLWKDTKFVHPSARGIQIHNELEAQGYDFAPPKGAFYNVD